MSKSLSIAFCAPVKTVFSESVKKELFSKLAHSRYVVKEYYAGYFGGQESRRFAEIVKEDQPDLIISLGLLFYKHFPEVISEIPIIYTGTGGLANSFPLQTNNITGVDIVLPNNKTNDDDIFVSLVKAIVPAQKSVILPFFYSKDSLIDTLNRVKDVSKKFASVGIKTKGISYRDKIPLFIDKMYNLMDGTGVAVFMFASVFSDLHRYVLRACRSKKVLIITRERQAIQDGADFSVVLNLEILGKRIAWKAQQILEHGKSPRDLPTEFHQASYKIFINNEYPEAEQLVKNSQLHTLVGQDNVHIIKRNYMIHYALPANNALLKNIANSIDIVSRHSMNECLYSSCYLPNRTSFTGTDVIVVSGEEQAHKIYATYCAHKKQDMSMPPIFICFSQAFDPDAYNKAVQKQFEWQKEKVKGIYTIYWKKSDTIKPLEAGLLVRPDLKTLVVPYNQSDTVFMKMRGSELSDFAYRHGIKLLFISGDTVEQHRTIMTKAIQADGVLFYDEHINHDIADFYRTTFKDRVILAGGLEMISRDCTMAHGYDTRELAQELFGMIHTVTHLKRGGEFDNLIKITPKHRAIFNEKAAYKQGGKLSKGVRFLLKRGSIILNSQEFYKILAKNPHTFSRST